MNRKATTIIILLFLTALGVWFFLDYMGNLNKTSYVRKDTTPVLEEKPIPKNVYPVEYPAREVVRQEEKIIASHPGEKFNSFTLSSLEPYDKKFEQGELTLGNLRAIFSGKAILTGHSSFSEFAGNYEFVPDEASLELLPVSTYIIVNNGYDENIYRVFQNANEHNKLLKVEISNYMYISFPSDAAGANAYIRVLGE